MSNPSLPLVSVGIPVYNGSRYLRGALDSLLGQDYANLEFVISDNGSTDETPEICREYAARDSRLTYHRAEQNSGAAWNFNRVFELSRGEFFMWAAADDRRAPDYITRCTEFLARQAEAVLCYSPTFGYTKDRRWPIMEDLVLDQPRPRDRTLSLLKQRAQDWPPILYGLIRSSALRSASPLANSYGGDVRLVVELLLQGPFVLCQGTSFDYCSEKRDENTRDYYERLVKVMHPGNRPRKYWCPSWSAGTSMLEAVASSLLPSSEKMSIRLDIVRLFFFRWIRFKETAHLMAGLLGIKSLTGSKRLPRTVA